MSKEKLIWTVGKPAQKWKLIDVAPPSSNEWKVMALYIEFDNFFAHYMNLEVGILKPKMVSFV